MRARRASAKGASSRLADGPGKTGVSGSTSTSTAATSHVAGRLAVGLGLLAVGLGVGALALAWPFVGEGTLPGHVSEALSIAAGVPFAVMGALICTRRPRNRIGWLMLAAGLSATGSYAASAYLGYGHHRLARLPVAWIATSIWVPALVALMFLLLLYPTGRLVSRRWRPVAWATGAWGVLGIVAMAVNPELADPALWNPISLRGVAGEFLTRAIHSGLAIGSWIVLLLAALASLTVRFRRARGVERQQLKWLVYVASVAAVANLFFPLSWLTQGLLPWLAIWAIPVAVGIAILRYRLYDIDLLITRTLVYGLLTAAITTVYLAIVVGIGTLVGSRGKPNLFLSIVATAVIAVAFQPARERSRRLANRLVYGKRATPYEVLSGFSHAMAGASTEDSLLRMARLEWRRPARCRRSCGCGSATCCSRRPAGPRPGHCPSRSRWRAAACRRPWP
jgi:hypothetical protein